MTGFFQKEQSSIRLSGISENKSESDSATQLDLMASRSIHSFYLMAKTIVSKVAEIERDRKKLVLVVDDEILTIQLIDEFLQEGNLDCKILSATNGRMAYEIATAVIPDLVITDWLIPEWDGPELIKQLKANSATRNVPIIMVTGVLAPRDEYEKILRSGAIDCIRKPLDFAEFVARVKAVLVLGDTFKEIEQKKESLHIKNQFVNFLVDAAPHPIFYQDKWGRFMGCNKHFEKLVDTCEEEIMGRMPAEILPPAVADEFEIHFSSLREIGRVSKFEIEMPQEDGIKHLITSYVGFGNSSIEVVIGSITDITEIIQTSKQTVAQLHTIHQQEKEQFESNVEKLQSELNFKHRELEMHLELLIHSKNVKEKLIEGVDKLQPFLNIEGKSKLFTLTKQLQREINEESELTIEKRFDELNSELYSGLEQICPEITKNEKRLCAYLKMNHSASDIAKITDRSLNSVNVGFARLRAKLGLPNTKDLRTYLNELLFTCDA